MTEPLRPWTIPNFLTYARLLTLPFFVQAVVAGRHETAFWLFLAAAATDLFDGFLARNFGMSSPLGAYLDPIADKLLMVTGSILYAVPSIPSVVHVPLWLVTLTVFRDLVILITALVMYISYGIKDFPPSWLGKTLTFLEMATLVSILLTNLGQVPAWVPRALFWAVLALTLASGFHYITLAGHRLDRAQADQAGRAGEGAAREPVQ